MIEFYYIKNSNGKFVMHPIENRKLFLCYLDALDFIEHNKNNGEVYELVRA
tara:strand:- start:14 stop:166 length:153 start_codon:yes stop_codon:yes gene_type:complete